MFDKKGVISEIKGGKMGVITKPNIVWFLIDSLRPDFLSVFGGPFKPTFIDELIKKGVSFTNCIVAAPYSIGSHAAMFTSFYASVNTLNGYFKQTPEDLDKNAITFVDILKAEGYFTAFYTPYNGRAFIPPYSFDVYDMVTSVNLFKIEKYLSASPPKLLMIGIDPIHDNCCACREEFTKMKYHESVVEAAEQVKYFYDKCCSDSDLIVISSDHGIRVSDEPANAHHSVNDESVTGIYLTDKTIKVPFSVIQKGRLPCGVVIEKMIRNIDITPTILDIAGVPILKGQGISLLPYIFNPEEIPSLDAFSETGGMVQSPWKPNRWCIRTPKWKLIVTKSKEGDIHFKNSSYSMELYDLETDSYETENKVEKFPELAQILFQKIKITLFNNSKIVKNYYDENNFGYKRYLRRRSYPFKIMLKVKLLRFINYELSYRLKIQIIRLTMRWSIVREIIRRAKRLLK